MAECVAICAGPLIGGVLAEYGGWRACFYVTIPIAVLSLVFVLALFRDIERPANAVLPLSEKLGQCDPIGAGLLVSTIVCLILALEWAGTYYNWTNFRVLLPLLLAAGLAVGFIVFQLWQGQKATLHLKLLTSRTTTACILYSGFMAASLYIIAYYVSSVYEAPVEMHRSSLQIPLWFQTAREKSTLGMFAASCIQDLFYVNDLYLPHTSIRYFHIANGYWPFTLSLCFWICHHLDRLLYTSPHSW